MQYLKLNSSINTAIKKKKQQLNSWYLIYTETIKSLIANDEAFDFMNTLKGTPAYWKRFLLEVLAMIKELDLPTFSITHLCANLRWHESIEIIYKLNEGGILTDDDIHRMNYFEKTKILNSNPVLVARHFQCKVEVKTCRKSSHVGNTKTWNADIHSGNIFQIIPSLHILFQINYQ